MDDIGKAIDMALSRGADPGEIIRYVTDRCHGHEGHHEGEEEEKEAAEMFGLNGFVRH